MHYNFRKDLEEGQKVEQEVAEKLKNERGALNIKFNKTKEYDISCWMPEWGEILIEVKYDKMSEKTGNIGIEYEDRNKSSGINVTTADKWIIKTGDDFLVIDVPVLKQLIKDSKYFKDVSGGDVRRTKMYLFKKILFKEYCEKL